MVISAIQGAVDSAPNESIHNSQAGEQTVRATSADPGTGGMQGTVVSVGDGTERAQLLDDSARATTTILSRFMDAMGGAASRTGAALLALHEAVEEINGLAGEYDDELSSDRMDVADDLSEGDSARFEGPENRIASTNINNLNGDTGNSRIRDGYEGDAEYLEDDDGEKYYDTVEHIEEMTDAEPDKAERLAVGAGGIAESSFDNGAIEHRPIEQLLGAQSEDLPRIAVGSKEDRDASEVQVQVAQQSLGSWLLRPLVSAAGGLYNVALNILSSQASEPPAAQASGARAPTETFSEQNLNKATALVSKIERSMQTLNLQLRELGAGSTTELIAPKDQINQPKLGTRDMLNRWYYKAQGGTTAAISTLGWATVGIGTAAIGANLPGLNPAMLTARATAMLGGAYLGLTALRDFPELATNRAAVAMISGGMPTILDDMLKLDDIMGQERARQSASIRAMLVTEARNPRIAALMDELSNVSGVLTRIEKGEIAAVPDLRHDVTLGDGNASAAVKNLASNARGSFASFFGFIGRGLASIIQHAITALLNVVSRWLEARAAGNAERTAAKVISSTLRFLATPGADSQISGGVDVRAKQRAEINGATHSLSFVRGQCLTGENLTRTLLRQNDQAFGAVAYGDQQNSVSVSASLTTARAMAWYLDAIASSVPNDQPDTTKVTRHEDGSLTILDPDRKLYSFLMNVPVAYTGTEVGDDQQSLAFEIDDHRQGMPQGMHGMRFETRLDDDGQRTLHLSFTPKKAFPVFQPLGNEGQRMINMYEAAYSAQLPKVSQGTDFSTWPKDRLMAHQNFLFTQINRENAMRRDDQQQVDALKNWRNPDFLSGRV